MTFGMVLIISKNLRIPDGLTWRTRCESTSRLSLSIKICEANPNPIYKTGRNLVLLSHTDTRPWFLSLCSNPHPLSQEVTTISIHSCVAHAANTLWHRYSRISEKIQQQKRSHRGCISYFFRRISKNFCK